MVKRNEFILHSLYVPDEGGFSDISYLFSQVFNWKYFGLKYGVGLQFGISYSEYSDLALYSLSPLVLAGLELILNPVLIGVECSFNTFMERSWKAIPMYDAYMDFALNSENSIRFDLRASEAEYFVDPWHMITSWSFNVIYRYRRSV